MNPSCHLSPEIRVVVARKAYDTSSPPCPFWSSPIYWCFSREPRDSNYTRLRCLGYWREAPRPGCHRSSLVMQSCAGPRSSASSHCSNWFSWLAARWAGKPSDLTIIIERQWIMEEGLALYAETKQSIREQQRGRLVSPTLHITPLHISPTPHCRRDCWSTSIVLENQLRQSPYGQ